MLMQRVEDYYRYCPNRPELKISDAVCLGRRRASYPYCRGCAFNDDEKKGDVRPPPGPHQRQEARTAMIEKVFKAYDVRATYPEPLNEEVAWRIGFATAAFLQTSLRGVERSSLDAMTVVVGRDMRKSSPSLQAAFITGVRAGGSPVIDIGLIDTPQIYFAINHLRACGGVQTTASHNPANYNGFKISGPRGVPIGSDTGLSDISRIAQNTAKHDTGKEGPMRQRDLSAEYKSFVRSFLQTPRPLKICIDASNGMAGKWAPYVFGDIAQLELHFLNTEHNGEFVHGPDPLVPANLVPVREAVKQHGADFGVCFDGDADRLILVDETATAVPCDLLTALLAKRFLQNNPRAAVVYDLRSSRIVAETIKAAGGLPRRERVGHAYMKKALSESKGIFGGELSGHFYFRDNFFCDSAMLALVHVINTLTTEGASLSKLLKPLRKYFSSGERNFENTEKDKAIAALGDRYSDGKVDFLDGVTVQYSDWWFNVRKSNTEPLLRLNVEATTPQLLESSLAELAPQLGKAVDH
jgi:phosphomannomutase